MVEFFLVGDDVLGNQVGWHERYPSRGEAWGVAAEDLGADVEIRIA